MNGVTLVAFVGLLGTVLLVVVALLVWQEARSRDTDDGPVYVIEDAVDHIMGRLSGAGTQMKRTDVLRILEYEIFYLQGLAQDDRKNPVDTVAGGTAASVEYISGRIADKHGVIYPPDEIAAVLALEAEYLSGIGAIGAVVEAPEEES
jgi:hypothetical protein